MYTNELKQEIEAKLLNSKRTSPNRVIYIPKFVEQYGLVNIIQTVKDNTQFLDATARLDERIYCVLNDVFDTQRCYCGNLVKFKRYQLGYADYCSVKCRANDPCWLDEKAQTNTERYGVPHIAQLPNERDKRAEQMRRTQPTMDYSNASKRRRETIDRLYGVGANTGWSEEAINTRINNKHMVPVELLDEYREYRQQVERVTKKQNLSTLPNIEKRGVLGKDEDAHHIDHMFSIYDGFMNDVAPEIVGNVVNLQCIPGIHNIQKGNNSVITLEQLYERYNNVRV